MTAWQIVKRIFFVIVAMWWIAGLAAKVLRAFGYTG